MLCDPEASLAFDLSQTVSDRSAEFSDLALQQLAQHTATADSMMHAAAFAQCMGAAVILHLCMCTHAPALQCSKTLLPHSYTLLYTSRYS